MAVTLSIYHAYLVDLHNKIHDMDTDVIKATLHTAESFTAADTIYTDLGTELSTANGYTSGGETLTSVTIAHTAGVQKFDSADPTWNATSAGITASMSVLRNSTPAAGNLVAHIDFGESKTADAGTDFILQVNGSNGWYTIDPT